MRRLFEKDDVPVIIGACIFLWCSSAVTFRLDFPPPKWTRQLSDENLTDVPKRVIQAQNTLLYPTRSFVQNAFNAKYRIDKARALQKTQRLIPISTEFNCSINGTRSLTRPTSVHEVRPGDIDVIGSVGDSLTVGTGSFSYIFPQLFVDYRGTSFSAGGQGTWREYLTLPNIIKIFNPKLIGYAYGDSLAEDRHSQFNVAEVGALSRDLPFMTKELVKRIKMDKRININEDWKLITIMMGPNTFCLELCYEDYTKYPEKHREEMTKALLYIKDTLPRTIINLIPPPNLEIIVKFTNLPPVCSYTHILQCPCLYATQYKHKLADYIEVMKKFQEVDEEIAENEELRNKDDFAVVFQPFSKNLKFPVNRFNTTDMSYLAVDCFHLSQKGYARLANSLWNNMMEPVGQKTSNWSKEFDRFVCPTDEHPYIRTWKNSMV